MVHLVDVDITQVHSNKDLTILLEKKELHPETIDCNVHLHAMENVGKEKIDLI
jgi:hypothetical protein